MVANLLSFSLIIGLGLLWQRLSTPALPADTVRATINALVFGLFLPALCVHVLHRAPLGAEALLVPAAAWITLVVLLAAAWATYRLLRPWLRLTAAEEGVLILAATFGNITYLGLPVLTGLFGPGAARYALFIDVLAHTPFLWLAGAALAAHYGSGMVLRPASALRSLLLLPPLWGCALGIGLNLGGVPLPEFLQQALAMLAATVVPLAVFSVGLALRRPKAAHLSAVTPALLLKLGLSPLLAGLAATAVGLSGTAWVAVGIEGAMPTMVVTLLIADRFGLDGELAATAIVLSTALSFLTLPLVSWLLTSI